jgi:hypothetical protein
MNELFYYFIFAIILYFVLTSIFANYNLEQENFDPSLIPISSIVTLAKVAQKLVNGNGILTNPANLQIGINSTAVGNLTVTGNSVLSGNLSITGSSNFTGPVKFLDGNLNMPGNLTTNGSITAGSSSSEQTIKTWGPLISNSITIGSGNTQFNGPVNTNLNLNSTDRIVQGQLNMYAGSTSPDSTIFEFGDGKGWRTRFGKASSPTLDVYDNGNVIINGNITSSNNLKCNSLITSNLTIGNVNLLATLNSLEQELSQSNIDDLINNIRRETVYPMPKFDGTNWKSYVNFTYNNSHFVNGGNGTTINDTNALLRVNFV